MTEYQQNIMTRLLLELWPIHRRNVLEIARTGRDPLRRPVLSCALSGGFTEVEASNIIKLCKQYLKEQHDNIVLDIFERTRKRPFND